MSYAVPARGFVSGYGDLPDFGSTTYGGAFGLAIKSVTTDPSISPILSPFSTINLSLVTDTIKNAVGTQLEAGLESVADSVIAALPDAILTTVGTIISDVVNVVPVAGPILKAITDIIAAAFGSQPSYGGSAQEQNDCQAFVSYFTTPASGGRLDPCQTCPSDIFFPAWPTAMSTVNNFAVQEAQDRTGVIPQNADPCGPGKPWGPGFCANFQQYGSTPAAWNTTAGQHRPMVVNAAPRSYTDLDFYKPGPNWELSTSWRPALGQALMFATEGAAIDPYEVVDPTKRAAFIAWQNKNYDACRQAFASYLIFKGRLADSTWWLTYGGVPPARRAQFQAIRRGIQACAPQYAPTKNDLRDAGVSLWPVYMDLLLNAFDLNQLNDEFVGFCLTYQLFLGAIMEGDPFFIDPKLGGYLANGGGQAVSPQKLAGLLMNTNWFGRGYVFYGSGVPFDVSVCAQNVAAQVSALVTNWRHTVEDTATKSGRDNLAKYASQAKAIASGAYQGRGPMVSEWAHPRMTLIGPVVHPVKKTHGSAAVMGAAAAAALIYLFL